MNTKPDGGPAFPLPLKTGDGGYSLTEQSQDNGRKGMSFRAFAAVKAMEGLLAAESESNSFYDVRIDPNTGKDTYRKEVYPLNPATQTEDYSKPQIPCPVGRTREQEIAHHSVKLADALIAELEKTS